MKKLFLALTIAASTFGAFAQGDANAPTMDFEKDAIDYGTIKQDADGNRTFKFKNTGTTPIIISEAHGSCGCTVPTYPKEPIMPGKSGKIEVKYNMGVGPIRKTITIESNASNYEGGRIPLKIKGEVYVKEAVNVLEKKKSLISIEN